MVREYELLYVYSCVCGLKWRASLTALKTFLPQFYLICFEMLCCPTQDLSPQCTITDRHQCPCQITVNNPTNGYQDKPIKKTYKGMRLTVKRSNRASATWIFPCFACVLLSGS